MSIADMDEVSRALLTQNVVVIGGDIDSDTVQHVYSCLAILEGRGSPDIEVRFSTGGGNSQASMFMYDALRAYKGKKTGVVYDYAYSAGVTILQACDKRVCLPHGKILIHHANIEGRHISLDTLRDPERLRRLIASGEEENQLSKNILAARTKKTLTEIEEQCSKEQKMTAEEALAFGLIDRIEQFD